MSGFSSASSDVHDLALIGGRVVDPESGMDTISHVAVDDGVITRVTTQPIRARRELDVKGMVVAPGWIDLHSHSHTVAGLRLQALDGVTTALELEAGLAQVDAAYRDAAAEGRPVNYGFSTSWAQTRMRVLLGMDDLRGPDSLLRHLGDQRWQAEASPRQLSRILRELSHDLDDGALGIGLLMGYAPGVDPDEYLRVSRLAAQHRVPTFTHTRALVEHSPDSRIDGAEELVRAAGTTGVHAHYCHVNSTSLRHVDRVLSLVDRIRGEGGRVSTEAYPYGAGMTAIGAEFLHPDRLGGQGLTPSSLVYVPAGERITTSARLLELRMSDPGGLAFLHFFDEDDPAEHAFIDRALVSPDTVIASDAMPLSHSGGRDGLSWPLPAGTVTHPRTAGTFSRVLRRYVRELGALSLMEAIRRCSLLPAQILQESVPDMRRKGRVQAGCDADLVVFDPDKVTDASTYDCSTRPSRGYRHVLVGGQLLVADSVLDTAILAGRPVRRHHTSGQVWIRTARRA